MKRIAVIGSGISGLAVAHALAPRTRLTLYEAGAHFGGHAHTVDLELQGRRHGVDTGFLVFNHRTYPRLTALFDTLGVATAAADMSFSVQVPQQGLEWSGSSLNSVFAQRRNLLRPRFLGMLAQILRFNRLATGLAEAGDDAALIEPLGEFLARHRFGAAFRDFYLLPMLGCIWSCPTDQMLRPVGMASNTSRLRICVVAIVWTSTTGAFVTIPSAALRRSRTLVSRSSRVSFQNGGIMYSSRLGSLLAPARESAASLSTASTAAISAFACSY